jgi:hypothetical protein
VLQDIGRDAANQGTPVFFDIVQEGATFVFRTWANVRGADRSSGSNLLVISPSRGSLGGTIELTEDWSDSPTAVATGGQGQDALRLLGASYNATLIGASPFGLVETFADATQLSTRPALDSEASSRLRAGRPLKVLTGSVISVEGAVYGLHWRWGDRIIAEFENESFVARLDGVTVSFEKGQETITAAIRGES